MNSVFRKLRWLIRRPDKEAELREEFQFHFEEEAQQRFLAAIEALNTPPKPLKNMPQKRAKTQREAAAAELKNHVASLPVVLFRKDLYTRRFRSSNALATSYVCHVPAL